MNKSQGAAALGFLRGFMVVKRAATAGRVKAEIACRRQGMVTRQPLAKQPDLTNRNGSARLHAGSGRG